MSLGFAQSGPAAWAPTALHPQGHYTLSLLGRFPQFIHFFKNVCWLLQCARVSPSGGNPDGLVFSLHTVSMRVSLRSVYRKARSRESMWLKSRWYLEEMRSVWGWLQMVSEITLFLIAENVTNSLKLGTCWWLLIFNLAHHAGPGLKGVGMTLSHLCPTCLCLMFVIISPLSGAVVLMPGNTHFTLCWIGQKNLGGQNRSQIVTLF